MLAEKNKDIGSALGLLKIISNDEKARMVYEAREAELMDQRTRIKSAIDKGRVEGRSEGRAEGRAEGRSEGRVEGRSEGRSEGKAEIIRALLTRGMGLEEVASIAGMDISGVAEIQKETLGGLGNAG